MVAHAAAREETLRHGGTVFSRVPDESQQIFESVGAYAMEDVQRLVFGPTLKESQEFSQVIAVALDVLLPPPQCRPPALSLLGFVGARCFEHLTPRTGRTSGLRIN